MATKKKRVRVGSAGAVDAIEFLEKLSGGPMTFGKLMQTLRLCDEQSLEVFSKRLGVSRANLCDIEKGRRGVSVERAAQWAKKLGYSEWQFVQLALQAELDAAGIKMKVEVKAA